MYYAHYHPHPRAFRHQQDQRFAPFAFLPFVTGTVFGLAASPFLFGRPPYPPYPPPYPPYRPPYPAPYGYGGYPY